MRIFVSALVVALVVVFFLYDRNNSDSTRSTSEGGGVAAEVSDAQVSDAQVSKAPVSPNAVVTQAELEAALPDFTSYANTTAKKHAFFSYLEPLISEGNAQILKQRQRLTTLLQQPPSQWSSANKQFLGMLSKDYQLADITESDNVKQAGTELLERVDAIPMSLPLAQGAIESAWGTSRFAREGNNLFGQWCWTPGCGIEPEEMGKTYHAVQRFDSVYDSVAAYLNNLNTQDTYAELRTARASMRAQGEPLNGYKLANYLQNYSQIGEKYVEEIHEIMANNNLSDLGVALTKAEQFGKSK